MTLFFSNLVLMTLVLLAVFPAVVADDGSNCDGGWFHSVSVATYCYSEKVYENQQILIEEQNQTNHELAMIECNMARDAMTAGDHTTAYQSESQCISKVLNDTK